MRSPAPTTITASPDTGAVAAATPGEPWRWHAALAVTVVALGLRLVFAAIVPLDPEEAIYWEYSRHLDLGYYDHPPMAPLLIRGGAALAGVNPFGARFGPACAGAAGTFALLLLARRLGGNGAALRLSVILACLPVTAVLFGIAAPDTPYLAASAFTLAALERALAAVPHSRQSLFWWASAGVALGAALFSKYTAAVIPVGVLLALVIRPALRNRLTEAGPYVGAAFAAACFAPVVIWNAQRDWVSFLHQVHHGFGNAGGSPWLRELELFGNQLALATPILFVLLTFAVVTTWWHHSDHRLFILTTISLAVVALFVVSAWSRRVNANWPAVGYVPAAVVLAVQSSGRNWRRWLTGGCSLGVAALAAFYIQSAYPLLLVAARHVPPGPGHGWESAAQSIATMRASLDQPPRTPWLAAVSHQDAQMLSFCLPDHPQVFCPAFDRDAHQYDFWPGFPNLAHVGDSLLLVLSDDRHALIVVSQLEAHFERNRQGDRVLLEGGGQVISERRLWIFEGWRGSWPTTFTPHHW